MLQEKMKVMCSKELSMAHIILQLNEWDNFASQISTLDKVRQPRSS